MNEEWKINHADTNRCQRLDVRNGRGFSLRWRKAVVRRSEFSVSGSLLIIISVRMYVTVGARIARPLVYRPIIVCRTNSKFVLYRLAFFYLFTSCSCRTGTYFLSITKESKQRSALACAFSQPNFHLLSGKWKLRVENALGSQCWRQCSVGSGTDIQNKKTLSAVALLP